MESTLLDKVVLPLALFVIMLGMGLSLVPRDFRRVVEHPRAFALGFCCQMLALPVAGLLVIWLIPMPPALAVGVMVLSFCPGGASSNLIAYLARGDVALSVSLTAIISVLTPFTIPVLTGLSIDYLMGENRAVDVPVLPTIGKLLMISLLPVVLGMLVRSKAPWLADRAEKPVKLFSIVFLFVVIGIITVKNWDMIPQAMRDCGLACLLLNVGTIGLGYGSGRLLLPARKQAVTIGVEVGIQNGTMALLVTNGILKDPAMSIPPAIYSLIMFATGFAFAVLVNLGQEQKPGTQEATAPAAA